jgi:acetyl esterase/lipase
MASWSIAELLDPEIAAALPDLPLSRLGRVDRATLGELRRPLPAMPLSDRVVRSDHLVSEDPPVRVRVHRPVDAEGLLPCVFSAHGGGLISGTCEFDDPLFDAWCPDLGIVGVSVEYRLAPETPYPGPLDDCYAGLQWVHANARRLGADPARIGVHGLSAGGGLAAAVALLARDRAEIPLAFQLLDSPMLDDRQRTPSSQVAGLPVWSNESNAFAWNAYLGDLCGTQDVSAYAAPARVADLSGLPPSFVSVGSLDGFRDEDVDYALRLNQAGVPCELHVYPGAPHGYQVAFTSRIARQAARDKRAWLARQLHPPSGTGADHGG